VELTMIAVRPARQGVDLAHPQWHNAASFQDNPAMPRKSMFAAIFVCTICFGPISFGQSAKPNKSKKSASKLEAASPGEKTGANAAETPKRGDPVATIAGQPVYEDDLLPSAASKLMPLRNQEYQIKKQALESLIDQRLLEAEAKKKGISTDKFLEQEVDAKVADPTDAEVNAYYLAQKNQLNRPFDEVKAQLKTSLKQAKIQQARQDFSAQLRKQSEVAVLLQPPKVEVSYDPARVRGNVKATVMIVEFADFQCPYCQQVESTLKSVLAKHEGQASLAFRDLPITSIHPLAEGAAEAARCAGEQGKFWEYHDLLYSSPNKLDRNGLIEHAHSLQLDEKQFGSCLTSEKYKAQIQADAQDGMRAGVSGTPGFFINGVYMSGALPEATFEKGIQDALAVAQNKPIGK
jgi:protein-disulfide isomerase